MVVADMTGLGSVVGYVSVLLVFAGALWAIWPQDGGNLIGPLFWYEIGRLERRRRTRIVRVCFCLLLLSTLWWAFTHRFPDTPAFTLAETSQTSVPIRESARFALEAVTKFMILQGLVVFVVTPAYLASAVAEDRERNILDGLFTTPLVNREIILGKMLGRLAFMASLILSGMPILCMTRVWGGVDISFILANYAITLLTLLSVGSLSILISTVSPDRANAIASSYIFIFLFAIACLCFPWCSPITLASSFEERLAREFDDVPGWFTAPSTITVVSGTGTVTITTATVTTRRGASQVPRFSAWRAPTGSASTIAIEMISWGAFVHVIAFLIGTSRAMRELRNEKRQEAARSRNQALSAAHVDETRPVKATSASEYQPRTPARPVVGDALLWKELYIPAGAGLSMIRFDRALLRRGWILPLAALMLGLCSVGFAIAFGSPNRVTSVSRLLAVLWTGIWSLAAGFVAVNSVRLERDKRTLDALLQLPVERVEILRAKWLGSVFRSKVPCVLLATTIALGLVPGALHPWSALLMFSLGCATVAFVASFGLWLSIVCRNGAVANPIMALVLMALAAAGPSLAAFGSDVDQRRKQPILYEAILSPIYAQYTAGFTWQHLTSALYEGNARQRFIVFLLCHVVGFAMTGAGAWFFWRLAQRRFDLVCTNS
jgi:ABC-type transport system involved in multi-copper enzyme maturation permease subunit